MSDSPIRAASEALVAALRTVPDLRVYPVPGTQVTLPAAVLGPPTLEWGGTTANPTNARFVVYVLTLADERALPRLWDLIPQVVEALDAATDAVVLTASPGFFSSPNGEFPCYEVNVEYSI